MYDGGTCDARTVHQWSWSLILMHACRYDACIYDAAEILSPTDGRTNKAILGVGCAWCINVWCIHLWSWSMHVCMILDPDVCMHVRCIYSWPWYMWPWCTYLLCIYQCSLILDSDACVYDAHIYDPRSLTLMHVCMMHISMILDLDLEACMYLWCGWNCCMCVWCIYPWCDWNFLTDGRTRRF